MSVVHTEERGARRASKRVCEASAVLIDLRARSRCSGLGAVAGVGAWLRLGHGKLGIVGVLGLESVLDVEEVTDERAVKGRDGTLYEIVDLGRDRDALPVAEVPFVHGAAARAHLRLGLGLVL